MSLNNFKLSIQVIGNFSRESIGRINVEFQSLQSDFKTDLGIHAKSIVPHQHQSLLDISS